MLPHKIADWNDADQVLALLAERHRDLAALEVRRDQAIDDAKADFGRDGEPVVAELDRLGRRLKAFVDEHREDLGGARSKKLERGTVAYRWTTKFVIGGKRVKSAIAWLLANKKLTFLHVEYKLNRETLRKAPDDVLKAIGARLVETDQFRYEVDDASYIVDDDE